MNSKRLDLCLWNDPSFKFTPWIISLMVYLATLSFLIASALTQFLSSWDTSQSIKLTIEVPPVLGETKASAKKDPRLQQIIYILGKTPEIAKFEMLKEEDTLAWITPLVGETEHLKHLPLSTLLEVELKSHNPAMVMALTKQLQGIQKDILVEDHLTWKKDTMQVAYALKVVILLIILMILMASIFTVIFTSKTSLIIHKNTLDILRILGAKNTYIARQFQSHALRLGLKGGFVGALFTFSTLMTLSHFVEKLHFPSLFQLLPTLDIYAIIFLVPIAMTLFMIVSTRMTVLRMLRSSHS